MRQKLTPTGEKTSNIPGISGHNNWLKANFTGKLENKVGFKIKTELAGLASVRYPLVPPLLHLPKLTFY
jgi:hypothetical protein